ncbi:hypothetical protein ACS0TY_001834 [Phlomoides rotata]
MPLILRFCRPSPLSVGHLRLPQYNVLINVDGGAAGAPGLLTGGGIYRDSFGVLRGCFAIQHGIGFAFEAELATALLAIEIAYDKQWLKIWLKTDSLYVVYILKTHHSVVPWRLMAQWHKIRRLMGDMHIVVLHIFREGNALADRLTREPVKRFKWWDQVHIFLGPYLHRDRHADFYRFSL